MVGAKIENVITLLFLLLLWIAWILPHGNKSKQYEQQFTSDSRNYTDICYLQKLPVKLH